MNHPGEDEDARRESGPGEPVAGAQPQECGAHRGARGRNRLTETAQPFSTWELTRAFRQPQLVIEYVLGGKERLARNLSEGQSLWVLAILLVLTSVLATVPYGALSPVSSFWKVAVLYTGSLFICFPCLHTFAQFLGFRFHLTQNLALSLVIPGVAGLFTFGFFPIIWFIDYTTQADADTVISPAQLSIFLLGVSLLMGIVQMGRCLALGGGPADKARPYDVLIGLWLPLLVFITYRMASLLAII